MIVVMVRGKKSSILNKYIYKNRFFFLVLMVRVEIFKY